MHVRVVLGCLIIGLCGCESTPGGVVEKVRYDFGLGERPEGYVGPTDQVFAQLDEIGQTEIKRLNGEQRRGDVLTIEEDLRLSYVREAKVYEDFYPLDAQPLSRNSQGERGFVGFIEYRYRVMRGAPQSTRVEAEQSATPFDTGEAGREVFRYRFSSGGAWNGSRGERTNR